MGRTIRVLLRALIGIIAIIVVMRFLGVTWADVSEFVNNGIKISKDVFSNFKGIFRSPFAL